MKTWGIVLFLLHQTACSPCGERVVTVGTLEVCAEVASTEAARRQGLTSRSTLAEDEGLLLDFPFADEICIVNQGVGFAIDAIYVDPTDRVTRVERSIDAGDARPRCQPDTQRVLEVAAGVAALVTTDDELAVAAP